MFNHFNVEIGKAVSKNVKGKRFYTTDSGGIYPSITTVLGARESKKQWLREWRNKVGHDVANHISRTSSARGTAVHKICEDYINNCDVEVHKEKFLPWCLFSQLKPVLDEKLNNIHLIEAALWSDKYRVAGRVDCIAEWNNVLSVVDFKTSKNPKKEEYIEDYLIQGSAYCEMYEELTETTINQVVILVVSEDGNVQEFIKDKTEYLQPLVETIDSFITQWEQEDEEVSIID